MDTAYPTDPALELRFDGIVGLGGFGDLIWTDDCTHADDE
jgi:hypothetical protein